MDTIQQMLYALQTFTTANAIGPIAQALSTGDVERANQLCETAAIQHDALVNAIRAGEWPRSEYTDTDALVSFARKFNLAR